MGDVVAESISNLVADAIDWWYKDDLWKKYKKDYPLGDPFIVACQQGSLEDIKHFVAAHNGLITSVKQMLEKFGPDSSGYLYNPLIAAAVYEQYNVLAYLLECGVNPEIEDADGWNALHFSVYHVNKKTSIRNIVLLIEHMSLDAINRITYHQYIQETPLDIIYRSPVPTPEVKDAVIKTLRQYGGLKTDEILMVDEKWLPLRDSQTTSDLSNSLQFPSTECPICLEKYTEKDRLALLKLECGHIFHKGCIIRYFRENYSRRECPKCRKKMPGWFPDKYIKKLGKGENFKGYSLNNKPVL